MCIPSATDAVFTLKVRNPKNFTLVTPTSSADAGRIIRFPHLSPQPVYGTDYALRQTASDTLTLVYKSAFLKKYEWNTGNIGPEITFISTDGRVFSERFNTNIEVNTPPKLSYATIAKTRTADATGKHYYVIILKADEMAQTAGTATPAEKLHKDIKTLSVTGRESGNVAFTSGDTAFDVSTAVPIANRRLLAYNEVDQLGSGEGPTPPSNWTTLNSDPWALRYRTDTEVRTAATVYTFRLADEKGLISNEISVSTSQTQAQDVQLFDGTNEIFAGADSSTPPSGMHTKNADSPADTSVTVKAKTATVGAIITGRVEKYNGSVWEQVGALVNSGSYNEVNIDLPAPTPNAELAYKITLTAGGIGFSSGNEKVFYVKVTKNTTITINGTDNNAWEALKHEVETPSGAAAIKIDGVITAPGTNQQIKVKRPITIEGNAGNATDKLNGNNQTYIFDIWPAGDLKLKKLTLQGGKNTDTSRGGGAIYCAGGKLTADDIIIENCEATKNGGGIYVKDSNEITLQNTQIKHCTAAGTGRGGAIYVQSATVTITGCTITGNTSTGSGGAIFAEKDAFNPGSSAARVTISGGIIGGTGTDANKTTGSSSGGGGIFIVGTGNTLTIQDNAQLIGNRAGSNGGGVCAIHATVTITGCPLSGNIANSYGGGVYAKGATVNITNCTLTGNEAALKGGAICAEKADSTASTVTISGGTIGGTGANDANKATGSNGEGGGIYAGENCTVTLQNNARVIGNKAGTDGSDGRGGGIYAEKATVNMTNCTFESNTATKSSGGVYASGATVTMTNCTLSGNKADNNTDDGTSGGIYTYQGNLTMRGCTLTGNTARLDGGGVRAESTPVTMTNCTFTGNKARCGGAICASGANVTVIGGTIGGTGTDANEVTATSQSSGGGIHIERGATVTLKGSVQVIGNKAPGSAEGAGVYVHCDSTLQMQESAQVDTNNDVFLQEYSGTAAKIIVAGALTPQGGIAARITVADNRYNISTQVLDGTSALLNSEHLKFSVTPKGSEYWVVKNDGYLSNTTTDIFANISKNQIQAAESSMSAAQITDRQTKLLNKLILYKTSENNYGIMHVTEVHNTDPSGFGHITFNYKTFNDDGTLKNAHDNREVKGTFFFDLDEESTSEPDSDFWLENVSTASSTRHFTPKNSAKFYVLP